MLIPLGMPEETLDELLMRLDGILFTGGGDVQPERYGSQPHPLVDDVDSDRDRVEIHLLQRNRAARAAVHGHLPRLAGDQRGIGRDFVRGYPGSAPGLDPTRYYPDWPRNYLAHSIQVEEGSRLRQMLGAANLQVNSLHHQGIRELAAPLRASASASGWSD